MELTGPIYEALTWAEKVPKSSLTGFNNMTLVDKVPLDLIHLVDHHWYQFPPLNPLWHGILGFVLSVLTLISVSGNFCVVYIFTCTKNLR